MAQPQLDLETAQEKTADATPTDENHFDAFIIQIGQFGRFQIINYVLLCLPIICNAFFSISYVFTTGAVVHRCNISQCDSPNSSFIEPWLNFTIPQHNGAWDQCKAYEATPENGGQCEVSYFNSSHPIDCQAGYKLRGDEITISSEFGIFCSDQWQLSMVGTVNNIGQFVGIPLGGFLADRCGRKSMLVVSGVLSALAGLARSFAFNYYSFLFLEFLDMAVGSTLFPTAFLLAIELVGPKHRVLAAMVISLAYGLAEAALGYLASIILDWRWLLRVVYTPAMLHLFFICLLPESVRWLLSQSRELEAVQILRHVSHVNRRSLPEAQLSELLRNNRQLLAQSEVATGGGHYNGREIFNALGLRIAQCCFVWFTNTFIALGLSLNASRLNGNKFYNFSMTGLMQLPGILLATLMMLRIGRRWSLSFCLTTCSILLIVMALLEKEIFPTNCRNSMLSFCSMVGRVGSMLAPQTPLLINYYKYAPHLLFATFGILSAILTLFFPETANKVLPTTLEEARALDKSLPVKQSKLSVETKTAV
ncbi:GH14433 [Drosophila grimshawi]|uniref:GH14433 n=1 Tax=Drosophila grimshawi TaxID=7222 RepID=B4J0Q7_DROGR|nr:GH14433 [Drosophila grimshawi]